MAAKPIQVLGHPAWAHDEGHASGTFHTFDDLDLGDGPRKIHVFLPRELPGRAPIAYLHDGDTAFWPGGAVGQTWDAAGVLDRMGPGRPSLILVAVHARDRNAEYTHADWAEGTRSWGGLPQYTAYLADQLKPFIDAAYPTRPEARHTAIVGSSHGGLAAFWQATRRPDRFGFAGCLSPSFFTGLDRLAAGGKQDTLLRDSALVQPVLPLLRDAERRPRLWVDWGLVRAGGEHNSVVEHLATERGREMAALLEEAGYRRSDVRPGERPPPGAELWVQEDPSGQHDELSWQRRFSSVLRAFSASWG